MRGCHTLADANAWGRSARSGRSEAVAELVAERVTNGMGVMPSFKDRLSAEEIADVAATSRPSRASSARAGADPSAALTSPARAREQPARPARQGRRRGRDRRRAYDAAVIDIRAARNDPERFRAALARRGAAEDFDRLLEADARWRAPQGRIDELRGAAKLKGKPTPEQLQELKARKEELTRLEAEQARRPRSATQLLAVIPSVPDPEAPDGLTDEDAVVLREVGSPPPLRLHAARPPRAGAPYDGSTWSAARGCQARVSPTAAATPRCSSSRSTASRSTG